MWPNDSDQENADVVEAPVSAKPKRPARGLGGGKHQVVRRQDHFDFGGQMHLEEQTWAVSYADFLMVLLSFFVIFFSIETKKEKDSLIFKIMSEIKGDAQGKGTGREGASVAAGKPFSETDAAALANRFKGFTTVVGKDPASLTVMFPDNVYAKGSYKLTGKALEEFRVVMATIQPFADQVEVLVTGHSDSLGVRTLAGVQKFEDNFELSSLRASAAIREAMALGISETNLRARAASSTERNTRSISITIQENK